MKRISIQLSVTLSIVLSFSLIGASTVHANTYVERVQLLKFFFLTFDRIPKARRQARKVVVEASSPRGPEHDLWVESDR